jgi:TPR repeat protein
MYFRGSGLPQDYGLAYRYFLAAAKNGDVISQRYIAIMYYKGIGLSKDERQAIRWFSVASKNGDLASKNFLSPNG